MGRTVLRLARTVALGAILVALTLGGSTPRSVESASNVTKSRVTFDRGSEVFWSGSGTNPAGWQAATDSTRAAGNQIVLTNPDSADSDHLATLQTLTLRSPASFSYRAELKSTATAWLGIAFHVQDAGNHYVLRVRTGGTIWELLKYAGGTPTTLGSGTLTGGGGGCAPAAAATTVPKSKYITLEARRSPSTPSVIDVYYQGTKQGSVTDSSAYAGGKIGLYSRLGADLFSNPEVEGDIQVDVQVNVDPSTAVRAIDPRMYGTSLSMFGVQNGIADIFTSEAVFQTASDKWFNYIPIIVGDLGPTTARYPGGLQGNNFFWTFGIGPVTGRYTYDYSGYDSNVPIGVDEALRFAEELGAQANLIVNIDSMVKNWGEATAVQYAADWVEYANSPDDGSNPNGGTDWAAVRAANGHAAPYGVKIWELGNELSYIPGRPSVYANRLKAFSLAMKAIDPTILIGALDDGFSYFYGANPLDWYSNSQGDGLLDLAAPNFDFWIAHPYGPSNYWSMVYRGDTCATVSKTFSSAGSYSFTFQAGQQTPPKTNGPKLGLSIDGSSVWNVAVTNGIGTGYSDYVATVSLTTGTHQISACAIGGALNPLYVDTLVNFTGPSGAGTVDFQDSQAFYESMVGTPEAIHTYFAQRELLKGGKPTYNTEWNTVFGTHNAAFDLKSMLTNATFFDSFLQIDMPFGNFFPLYAEKQTQGVSPGQFVGAIEGVAWDDRANEMGRTDPRMRPSAYFLEIMQKYFKGNLVHTLVTPHGFAFGPSAGFTAGGITGSYSGVPTYVTAYSALSASGNTLAIAAVNKDMANDLDATFHLGTFTPSATATMITLQGDAIGATNEPEDGPSHVTPVTTTNPAGSTFTYRLPRHSFTLILLPKQGSDPSTPAAPTGLGASLVGSSVGLSWNAVAHADLAGYNVYRTRLGSGPFGGKLNEAPLAIRSFTDSAIDRGVAYRYAVKAVDSDGHESALSNVGSVAVPGGGPVTSYPTSAAITQGTGSSPVANLALADLITYDVTHQGGVTDWNATFTVPQAPANIKSLAVFLQARNSAGTIASPATGQLYLYNHTTAAWDAVVSTTFVKDKMRSLDYGTTQATDLAKYISGTGEVKVRMRMSGAALFTTSCDFLAVRTTD